MWARVCASVCVWVCFSLCMERTTLYFYMCWKCEYFFPVPVSSFSVKEEEKHSAIARMSLPSCVHAKKKQQTNICQHSLTRADETANRLSLIFLFACKQSGNECNKNKYIRITKQSWCGETKNEPKSNLRSLFMPCIFVSVKFSVCIFLCGLYCGHTKRTYAGTLFVRKFSEPNNKSPTIKLTFDVISLNSKSFIFFVFYASALAEPVISSILYCITDFHFGYPHHCINSPFFISLSLGRFQLIFFFGFSSIRFAQYMAKWFFFISMSFPLFIRNDSVVLYCWCWCRCYCNWWPKCKPTAQW